MEKNNQEMAVKIFNFQAHYIKLNLEDIKNGIKAEIGFITEFSILATDYEDARSQALNRAQDLLKELKDSQWYMRLMKN